MTSSGCCPPAPSETYNTKRIFYHLEDVSGISGNQLQVFDAAINPDYYTVIDVATLAHELTPIKQNDAYVINLEILDISFSAFQKLFYPTLNEFTPNLHLYNTKLYDYVNNNNRRVVQVCRDSRGYVEPSFNLYDEIVHAYEMTLGVKSECWVPCSLTNLHKSVAKVNNLLDVGGCCNVECALTFEEFVLRAMQNGVTVDDTTGDLSDADISSCDTVIVAAITALFKSTTKDVPDIQVNWPFKIDWGELHCNPKLIDFKKLAVAVGGSTTSTY